MAPIQIQSPDSCLLLFSSLLALEVLLFFRIVVTLVLFFFFLGVFLSASPEHFVVVEDNYAL
jgi:hypothetical protein